jgi:hypothetical protein
MFTGRPHQATGNSGRRWMIAESSSQDDEVQNPAYRPARPHIASQRAVDDLVAFMDRDHVPVVIQAAVAHAQFETIHPFIDGNGRSGRALVHALLRGKGLTRYVTVPVSAGLLVDVGSYFQALEEYRRGDLDPITHPVVNAAVIAQHLDIAPNNVYAPIRPLIDGGVITQIGDSKRGRIWRSNDVLRALDAFAARAGKRHALR